MVKKTLISILVLIGLIGLIAGTSLFQDLDMRKNDIFNTTNVNSTNGYFDNLYSNNWTNVSITESQISDFKDYYLKSNPFNFYNSTTIPNYILSSEESNLNVNNSDLLDGEEGLYYLDNTEKSAGGVYLYNDTTAIYLNETKLNKTINALENDTTYTAGSNLTLDGTEFNWDSSWSLNTFIKQVNEGDLNVNSSNYWDGNDIPSDLNYDILIKEDNITDLDHFTNDDIIWSNGNYKILLSEDNITDENWIEDSQEPNLNVNSSDYWDSYDVASDILFSALDWDFGDNWNYISGDNFYFNESKLSTKYYNATSIQTVAGTPSGTLSDIQTRDEITYNITETNSVPGLDFRANFTDVGEINQLYVKTTTNKNQDDTIAIQLWNYDKGKWDTQQSFTYLDDYQLFKLSVFDGKYISSGEVQMRLYQSVKGKTQEEVYIDWVALAKGYGTPASEDLFYLQELNIDSSNINDTIKITDGNGNNISEVTINDNYEADTTIGNCSETGSCQNITYDNEITGSYPTAVNLTSSKYNASLGGYSGANSICQSEYPNSHLCNEFEIIRAYNHDNINLNNKDAWISAGAPKYVPANIPVDDCKGWTYSGTSSHLGNYWHFNQTTGGEGRAINCGTELPLCCATYN